MVDKKDKKNKLPAFLEIIKNRTLLKKNCMLLSSLEFNLSINNNSILKN